jgi:adenylosuccinate lyase
MDEKSLRSLSPLDGRYHEKTQATREIFSELGLIKHRLKVEVEWLKYFLNNFREDLLTPEVTKQLEQLSSKLPDSLALRVKEIEKTTNHDVKAVELALAEQFDGSEDVQSLIHVFLTSEDVNSVSYALMLKDVYNSTLSWLEDIQLKLKDLAEKNKDLAMLSRTHGQPASPTTLGKEINVFKTRLNNEYSKMKDAKFYAKWGGATANYNPHKLAFPNTDWIETTKKFFDGLDLELTKVTTQIEPHDYMADLFHSIVRANNILLDLTKDIWTYISLDYFSLKLKKDEVGSSTMPHKVNPIDFENAEGNLGLSNAIFIHLADKLTISRLQRDLSDSTALRNIGSAFGYLEIAKNSMLKGLDKLEANEATITSDLESRYELLAEALQSFLRLEGMKDGYDKVKELSRGQRMDKNSYLKAVDSLVKSEDHKKVLKELTPETYIGIASDLAEEE